MRAIVHDRYGPPEVLRLEEVERPVPKDDEVLVGIRATTVTRADAHLRSGSPFVQRFHSGLLRPKRRILGHELAGEVVTVGAAVADFKVGDRVFGALPYLGLRTGSHAEFMAVPARWPLAPIPEGMPFEQAAAVSDGALSALNALRPAHVGTSTRMLIYGASGSIGTAGVQLARHFGAHVTAVCNTKNDRKQDVLFLRGLLEAGEYRPVIDRTYPLEQVVEATKYVETQQKTGNVVLTLDGARPR